MKLSPTKIRELRQSDAVNGSRLAKAMDLGELTQAEMAAAVEVTQPYVSDVARGRHSTITVENARKFSDFFGCSIEDLFPSREKAAVAS